MHNTRLSFQSMAMTDHIILFIMLLLCGVVMPCYFNRATAAAGVDETSISVNKKVMCLDHEREALLQFKQHITRDHCGLVTSWGRQEDCCQWRGIRCSNLTGHVTMLHLRGDVNWDVNYGCLEGKVISPLFELRHLKYLDLSWNSFHSTIPKSIDSLTNLKHLNLSHGDFYGEIPPQLGNITNLASLDLNHNWDNNYLLTSKSLHWLSSLTSLREINLGDSDLSEVADWLETINKIHSLRELYMDDCNLPPIIPSSLSYINSSSTLRVVSLSYNNFNDTSIFQWLFNLSSNGCQFEYLDLSANSFSGSFSSAFRNLHSPTYLSLSQNLLLDGVIPDIFSNMKSLRVLLLSSNNFHGSISNVLRNLCHLKKLDLSFNSFSEDLSNFMETLLSRCSNKSLLEYVDLSHNRIWGSIPDRISTLGLMRELYLDGNDLNGTIIQGIGKLSMLEKLGISNNSLEGTLNHNHFSNLSRLRELYLSDNRALVIKVDDDWLPPFQLDIIGLRSCKLGPTFPKWLLTQNNFSYLDISNSQISGNIPNSFWVESFSPPNLHYLNLSQNMLHGVLPNLTTTCDCDVVSIDLSSNYFQGSIPTFFGFTSELYLKNNMFTDATNVLCPKSNTDLENIDLSNNLLSGELPDCWMQFDSLQSLHLENNQFFGKLPNSIGTLNELQFLHLENNSFTGEFPLFLKNCTSLVILDLGYNYLTGHIPSNLGNVVNSLGVLNLRRNNFLGNLPYSLCQLSRLQILDLASNHISGTIPNCIHNLTAMTRDRDQLDDLLEFFQMTTFLGRVSIFPAAESAAIEWKKEEREFGYTLRFVKMIDLSCNEIEGNMPDGISRLTGLISLDLSSNKLSGSIAKDIGQLTSLEFLNVSNNHLSGNIPTSLAQVSTLGTLDLSNNNLSGRIPHGTQLQGFDPSFYRGNPLLCGMPLQGCSGDNPHASTTNGENSTQHEHKDDDIYPGLYISVVLGFIIGFWGVCGTLVLKRSWRHTFFQFIDDVKDKLHVMVVVNVARIWRKT